MPTTSAAGRRSESGVKSTTSAKRIDAAVELVGDRLRLALSLSAIDRGRMLSRRLSAFACSIRSAASASWRCCAKTASSVKTIVPPTATLSASIVVVNQRGQRRRDAAEQLAGDPRAEEDDDEGDEPASRASRTSLNTSAPSGARMPQRPTPPEARKPPSGIIDSVGARRMATWPTRSSSAKSRVREKTTIAPSKTTKYSERHHSRPASRTRGRALPQTSAIGRIRTEIRTSSALLRACPRRPADPRRSAPDTRARDRRRSGSDSRQSRRRPYPGGEVADP